MTTRRAMTEANGAGDMAKVMAVARGLGAVNEVRGAGDMVKARIAEDTAVETMAEASWDSITEAIGAGDAMADAGAGAKVASASAGTDGQQKRRRSQNRQLELLRDFLGKGAHDTAANRMWASCEEHKFAVRHSAEGKAYGCRCKGVRAAKTPELWCGGCEQFFHVSCERLSLSRKELDKLRDAYVCCGCERVQLEAAGVDLLPLHSTVYECRYCERVFTSERGIRIHTARCAAKPEELSWSCLCKGSKLGVSATQCATCVNFFHKKCRAEGRPSWETESDCREGEDALCELHS
ncbi:hypothetical protein T492DRAFT_894319 [Pavlovales sp. CCMP2436]|nr:hypothetical protein T492DRAFT_894319 [Pavlovales sp. CCMP2436]